MAYDPSERDPFTAVYGGLWTLLENLQTFCNLVPEGNRIKYDQETVRTPEKREARSADYPEVRITVVGGEYKLNPSSSHCKITKKYQIQIGAGDMRLQKYLHPIELAVIAAMTHWAEVLLPMTWCGHKFVTALFLGTAPEGLRQSDIEKDVRGWSNLVSVSVDLFIPTVDLEGVP